MRTPAHALRSDFARVLAQKFPRTEMIIVGEGSSAIEGQVKQLALDAVAYDSAKQLPQRPLPNGQKPEMAVLIWIYPCSESEDAEQIGEIARMADEVVLLPGNGADVAKRRPQLVERFRELGFAPDYGRDLSDLNSAAIQLTRRKLENSEASLPDVEKAFARLNQRVQGLERSLRTRMSELEAADRHIARLEEKVLSLKEAKRSLKQLKQEKQALRKSPERRVGQVLLAPYRLPQKLYREVTKRIHRPATEGAESAREYQVWLEHHRVTAEQIPAMREEATKFTHAPLFSILMPVFNTPVEWLEAAVDSVLAQVYEKWELVLIDDASTDEATIAAVARLTNRDSRIRFTRLEQNGGISAASNRGLELASGDRIGLLDHDDLLEPDALFQNAKLLQVHPDADLIYSDEDKLTAHGFDAPFFKPDWSPDFFLSYNYICHFTTWRRALVDEVGGFRSEFDGAQDYDLFLRMIERTSRIRHIPRVLYHWRRSDDLDL